MLLACSRTMHHSIPPTSVLLAASTDAWAAHRQDVTKACIRASGLVDARLVGSVISFDDSVGRSAALIAGRYPQAHMARAKGLNLCLFDRRSRTTQAAPADDWR
jgi:hypothetical protein